MTLEATNDQGEFVADGMSDVTFRSRVDAWLVITVTAALVLVLLQGILAYSRSPGESFLVMGLLACLLLLMRLIAYPCEYTLASTHLLIRFGVVRVRIAYADVTSVEPSHSLWSAPALSLHRVKVRYAGRFLLISPVDRERFITLLRERVAAAHVSTIA